MDALQFSAKTKRLSLAKLDVPKPQEGEVLIKVAYAGICGTDLHIIGVSRTVLGFRGRVVLRYIP